LATVVLDRVLVSTDTQTTGRSYRILLGDVLIERGTRNLI
jgi:hypothetical protein